MYKTAFVAFFQGEQLKSRIKKVCTGFHASLYPCPNSHAERLEMVKGVRTRLEDLNLVKILLTSSSSLADCGELLYAHENRKSRYCQMSTFRCPHNNFRPFADTCPCVCMHGCVYVTKIMVDDFSRTNNAI